MTKTKKVAARPKTKAEPVRVAFAGQIKSIRSVIDAAGDKVGTLTLTFNPKTSIIAELDKLQEPDTSVFVVIMEKANE